MAYRVNEVEHNGYVYKIGDRIKISNKLMYTNVSDKIGNTFQQLEQCIMEIIEIWAGTADGAPVRNPIKVKWASGPSGSYTGNGFVRLDQIATGSGGGSVAPPAKAGNVAVYPYDTRMQNTVAGTWAEAFLIDWNSFEIPAKDRISKYEIYYQEAPDVNGSPGAWSASIKAMDSSIVENAGKEVLGSVNQSTDASSWGTRGCWYRFSVKAIYGTGGSSGDLFTNPLRKCLASRVDFDVDGGTGAPKTQYKFQGYSFIIPADIPQKPAHEFECWTYGGQAYQPKQTVGYIDGDIAFTAQFRRNQVFHIYRSGVWVEAIPYISQNSAWKEAVPYIGRDGTWKEV